MPPQAGGCDHGDEGVGKSGGDGGRDAKGGHEKGPFPFGPVLVGGVQGGAGVRGHASREAALPTFRGSRYPTGS
ncbi:hypothetical protein GCM10010304_70020 [Streptomyces roseoviolaceus]